MNITNVDSISFEAIHRLGSSIQSKPRPLIFCLSHRPDRERIWAARRNLKGTPYSLAEDLPEPYLKARHMLMPVMAAARTSNLKASFVADKIRVDGRLYGVQDMKRLPTHLSPEIGCTKESDDVISFFGRHSPFSNFYECKFTIDGHSFNCTEQYIQKCKAEVMGHDNIALRVHRETDPAKQKQLCSNLKGDIRKWDSTAKQVAYKAIQAKFQQNEDLQEYLQSTGAKHLAEAGRDPRWGTGTTLRNPQALLKDTWTGENWLGHLLMKVRDEQK